MQIIIGVILKIIPLKYTPYLNINSIGNYFLVHLLTIKLQIMTALYTFLAIGPWQIAIVVLVVLLLFGGKKIPELMRGLGSGIKEFKDASKEDDKLEENKE